MSRRGHLEQAVHIIAFLKSKPKLTLYFDPRDPPIFDESAFQGSTAEDFKEIYRDGEEEELPRNMPRNMPRSRGRQVSTTAFVDASHASCLKTRRSQTGFILFINRAPIIWFSKRQNPVESSTFSSEL